MKILLVEDDVPTAIASIKKTLERYKDTFQQRVSVLEQAAQALSRSV